MPTAERLRELLDYDPATGVFRWNIRTSNRTKIGARAGSVSNVNGYVEIGIDGQIYLGHRLAFLWVTGKWPTGSVDHHDCNRSNNAWGNLRAATKSQNAANSDVRKGGRSGLRGVFPTKSGKWFSKISIDRKIRWIGTFSTREEAHAAYKAAAIQHFGEFARF